MIAQPRTTSAPGNEILIVGGYGQVGRAIAERLAPLFPNRVVVAGRDSHKAKRAAAEIGRGTRARAVDITGECSATALDKVMLVLVCLDQTDTHFVEYCLACGVHYLDISANSAFFSRVEQLDMLAKRNAAAAALSVGVAPGLTNLIAARARQRMDHVDRIDIVVELGLGDRHGRAAVEWMLDNLDAEFHVRRDSRNVTVRSFEDSIDLAIPGQGGPRPAYRFNFSDQHVIGRTLDVPTVSSWVRFDSRTSTWLIAKSVRAGLARLLRRRRWRKRAVWLFMNAHLGSDVCGVAVRAEGRTNTRAHSLTLGVVGRKEAQMTAIIAAETARQILAKQPAPGVFHSEQVVALDPIVRALQAELPGLVVTL